MRCTAQGGQLTRRPLHGPKIKAIPFLRSVFCLPPMLPACHLCIPPCAPAPSYPHPPHIAHFNHLSFHSVHTATATALASNLPPACNASRSLVTASLIGNNSVHEVIPVVLGPRHTNLCTQPFLIPALQ